MKEAIAKSIIEVEEEVDDPDIDDFEKPRKKVKHNEDSDFLSISDDDGDIKLDEFLKY